MRKDTNLFQSSEYGSRFTLSLVFVSGLQHRLDFPSILVRSSLELFGNWLGKEITTDYSALLPDWSDLGTGFILSERQGRQTQWYHRAQPIDSHPSRWQSTLQSKVTSFPPTGVHYRPHPLFLPRLLLKLDCQMKLQKFPLDNQTCVVNIGSCMLHLRRRFISLFVSCLYEQSRICVRRIR